MKIKIVWLLALLIGAAPAAAQDKIVVGGSGSLIDEMIDAAKAYMAKNPNDEYKFYHEHGAITLGEPQGLAKRFMAYLHSPEGQKSSALDVPLGC